MTDKPQPLSGAAQPAPKLWSYWYSKKHSEHYADNRFIRNSVLIDGQRVEYTEATDIGGAPSCSTDNGGSFDDYVFLGTANPKTICIDDKNLPPAAPVAVPAEPRQELSERALGEVREACYVAQGDAWKEGNELLKKVAAPLPPPQEPKVLKVSFQRELTVWLSPDKGREQADADVSAIKDGATILKVGTELYFNRLRLLVEQDPSLERRIAVFFTDANGIIHEIGLTKEAELKWPAGFFQEGWENEIEIGKLRRAKKR